LFYIATAIFYLLLIAHLVECVVYRKKILSSTDTPFVAFSMTLLFGVIYLGSIKDS
jgi:tellurite resistance protein TehA-like permease